MRIALVSEHASPLAACGDVDAGGQNVYVDCLSRHLATQGHDVMVLTRRDDPASPDRIVTPDGVTVQHLAAGPAEPVDKDDLLEHMDEFAIGLGDALQDWRPDVLHSHFWMSGRAAQPVASSIRVPWVHTFHALGTVRRRYQRLDDHSPPERQAVESAILRRADAIIATCSDEVRELRAMGATRQQHIEVVPCGFDARRFRPAPQRGADDVVRIVAVSRLVPRKGLADVINALRAVPRARLIVVGGRPEGAPMGVHERDLHQLVDRLGLADRVRFLGALPPAEVAPVLQASDFFVAAPWYEPFGIAPVEAMGCGLPVVGTGVGGLLDTVVDRVTGVLVPPRDVPALAHAMALLTESPRLRARMGRRASERAHRLYPWDVVARRIENTYCRVAQQGPALAEVSA